MSTQPNLLTNLLPGNNPTGTQFNIPYGTPSASPGANPLMPPVPSGPTSTTNNPYNTAAPIVSTFPANSSPYQSTSLLPTGSTSTPGTTAPPSFASSSTYSGATGATPLAQSLGLPATSTGQDKLLQTLSKTYGAGLGTALYNFLAGGAGFNQDAVNNLIASMQPGFESAQENLMTQFSAGGNRFGSGAQIGLADLQSQEQLDIGQLETQMYEQSVNDYISVLTGTEGANAARKAQPSTLDQILSGIGGIT